MMRIVSTMRKSTLRAMMIFIATFNLAFKLPSATFIVVNTLDSGAGSLRQAMLDANANPGNDMIIFNLGAGGPFTINLLSALPSLTDNTGVTIDGWNNSGNDGIPNTVPVFTTTTTTPLNPVYKIILGNGNNVPTAFVISSTNNLIRGLVMQNFGDGTPDWNDIAINISAKSNTILGCYIGMDETGTTKGTRTCYGIWISGGNNIIGDGTPAGVNLISGTMGNGSKILITSTSGTANIVRGNIIGLQSDGTSLVSGAGNGYGITLQSSAGTNTIGGILNGEGNLISGNFQVGVRLYSNNNVLLGNYIGPMATGLNFVTGNAQSDGIATNGSGNGNIIGGPTSGARNLISGNSNSAINCSSANNQIKGNYIGVNKNGTASFGNQGAGITLSTGDNNLIGGLTSGEGNLISGNTSFGILVLSHTAAIGCSILQNTIGPQINGLSILTSGSQGTGITLLNSNNNNVGGAGVNSRNIISANGSGITISSNSSGNSIRGNYIGIAADGINRIVGANQARGIFPQSGATNNSIGGTLPGEGNVISGNTTNGIQTNSTMGPGNLVIGNIIGPQADGISLVAGNTQANGLMLNGPGLIIGGSTAASRNIISGNNGNGTNGYGINISNSTAISNIIQGNYIGPGSN